MEKEEESKAKHLERKKEAKDKFKVDKIFENRS